MIRAEADRERTGLAGADGVGADMGLGWSMNCKKIGQRGTDFVAAFAIPSESHSDRVHDVAARVVSIKIAEEIRLFHRLGKKHRNRLEMPSRHGENVRRLLNQIIGDRLAAVACDIDALFLQRLNGVETWRLPGHRATPAESTAISPRDRTNWRNSPSAIGLRQMFPVQMKRTFFTGSKRERDRSGICRQVNVRGRFRTASMLVNPRPTEKMPP